MYTSVKVSKSSNKDKKLTAVFTNDETGKHKTVHFGASGYSDYTKNHDDERKERYINRHKKNEDWKDPTKAGTLSRFILWNKDTVSESIKDYKKKFHLK